jgi:hypothetical protein
MTARTHAGRRSLAALLLLAFGAALPGCALSHRERIKTAMQTPRRAGRARLEVRQGIPVLHLYGTGTEMARQYGTLLKTALGALSGYADAVLPPASKERFIDYARRAEPKLPEGLRAELRSAADAADMPHLDLVAMNVVPRLRCTALAVWGAASFDGRLVMGRNADYFGMGLEDRGSMVVVFHSTQGRGVVMIGFLGMLGGFTGINAEGVAFGNLLAFNAEEPTFREGGLPIQLAMRLAAGHSRDAEDMAARLTRMPHVIPMNVMVADAAHALVVELGVREAHVRRGEGGVLAVSNDFLVHPGRHERRRCPRLRALRSTAEKHRGRMGVRGMTEALYAARLVGMNLQAAVFEPEAMRMHVSVNRTPAAAGPYRTFDVRKLLAE